MLGLPRRGVALFLVGVLVLFVGVVAQLAVTGGLAETIWVVVSVLGGLLILAGIVVFARSFRDRQPPED